MGKNDKLIIGLDYDGTITASKDSIRFFRIITHLLFPKNYIYILTNREPGSEQKIAQELKDIEIKYSEIVITAQKAEYIRENNITIFFENQDESFLELGEEVLVFKVRESGNFSFAENLWIGSKKLQRLWIDEETKRRTKEIYELEDFPTHVHLWNIVPGGSGKSIVMLRKIVDSIQAENYLQPYKKLPSFLIIGEKDTGKNLVARALVNSLAIEDIRECPAQYFDNGIPSSQFFRDSLYSTAHIISNIENLNKIGESVLWRYLKLGVCKYYNYITRNYDLIQQCHGMIIMTATERGKLPKPILNAVNHIIELEPYNSEQVKIITHQLLKFCNIDYPGEEILQAIVEQGAGMIGLVIEFLKICILIMKAELRDSLDMEIVEKANRMWLVPVPAPPLPEDILF